MKQTGGATGRNHSDTPSKSAGLQQPSEHQAYLAMHSQGEHSGTELSPFLGDIRNPGICVC